MGYHKRLPRRQRRGTGERRRAPCGRCDCPVAELLDEVDRYVKAYHSAPDRTS